MMININSNIRVWPTAHGWALLNEVKHHLTVEGDSVVGQGWHVFHVFGPYLDFGEVEPIAMRIEVLE